MEKVFKLNQQLCGLFKIKLDLLTEDIKIVTRAGYIHSIYNSSKKEVVEDINALSSLFTIIVEDLHRRCKQVGTLRKYVGEDTMKRVDIRTDHCIKLNRVWALCDLCTRTEDVMIRLEQLAYLKDPNLFDKTDINSCEECIWKINLKQNNLIYATQNIYNIIGEIFIEKEEEKFQPKQSEETCPICMELATSPVWLDCMHQFCHKCIKKYINVRKAKYGNNVVQCPTCNNSISKEVIHNIN